MRSVKEPTCPRGWSARYRLTMQHRREAVARAWRGVLASLGRAVRSIPGVTALLRFSKRRKGLPASTSTGSMRRTGSDLFESQAGAHGNNPKPPPYVHPTPVQAKSGLMAVLHIMSVQSYTLLSPRSSSGST